MTRDVVFVHGVWMPGTVMVRLKQHLEHDHGFRGHLFSYASIRGTLDENAELLADFIRDLGVDNVHLVGHSLGGIVSLRMLALNEDAPPGRVVCLGSPLCGCRAATSISQHSWGSSVLGKALVAGVLDESIFLHVDPPRFKDRWVLHSRYSWMLTHLLPLFLKAKS